MKSQYEVVDYTIHSCETKVNRTILELIILGILSGIFIAFGASGNLMIGASLSKIDVGFAKFLGASLFSVGLIFVIIFGSELFTSNTMSTILLTTKKATFLKVFRNLSIVYISNFIGSIIVAFITYKTSSYNTVMIDYAVDIAKHKVNASSIDLFLKGFLCNIMVCGAVISSYSGKDVISKIFAIWFPITLFVILGYDHCVANMFYIPTAMFFKADITISQMFHNLIFATIGNFVGGYITIHSLYLCHFWKKDK